MSSLPPAPPDGIFHHEDIELGRALRFGRHLVSEAEIIAFAKTYDPQPMHVDPIAAAAGPMGGLCASGMHTAGLMMRMLCDGLILKSSSLGSPGIQECRWLKPVRPGDTLSVGMVATEARVLGSRPEVGVSKMVFTTFNQHDEPVMELRSNQMLRLREPGRIPPHQPVPTPQQQPQPRPESLWADTAPTGPSKGLYFEDRAVGETIDLGQHTFDRDGIMAFATQFDPQRFHLDEEAGRKSLFGGLSASGWQTASIYIRKIVDQRQAAMAALSARGHTQPAYGPSPGFRDLRWLRPVLVNDTIEYRTRLIDKRPLASKPDRGLLTSMTQGRNQRGEVVFSVLGQIFAERRPQ